MQPDRWHQIEDLCHAALACPVEERGAFLANACQGDDELRREVESLPCTGVRRRRFHECAGSGAAGISSSRATTRRPCWRAVRRVHDPIVARRRRDGRGVSCARRNAWTRSGDQGPVAVIHRRAGRRARFEREARILATLNHPHIGAIYGIEEADGVRGLVLELVEGETLAESRSQRRALRQPASRSVKLSPSRDRLPRHSRSRMRGASSIAT